MKVKIVGAGSAGMHHAHAARQLGWDVAIGDIDDSALERLPNIYAMRYGAWDEAIEMPPKYTVGGYDIIIIATPPATHIALAQAALLYDEPKVLLIEKPLCSPNQVKEAETLLRATTPIYVGYTNIFAAKVCKDVGAPVSLDVSFQEHWSYILKAHPWLKSENDSYLGSTAYGGGALCEHSHALNLWQHIARELGQGEVTEIKAVLDTLGGEYDQRAVLLLTTDTDFHGLVTQDVFTSPAVKRANLVGTDGTFTQNFGKCPFKTQLEHVANAPKISPIALKYGLSTMKLIEKAIQQNVSVLCP